MDSCRSSCQKITGEGQARSIKMATGVVCLAAAHLAFAFNVHFERAVGSVGRARVGIVAEAVLRAKFPVNAIEHFAEFTDGVREISGAAGRIRNSFERVLAGRVAASLI